VYLAVRQRPGTSQVDAVLRGADVPSSGPSFPSGHVILVAAIACVVAPTMPVGWTSLPALLTLLVMLGRVYVGAHNPLDVTAGLGAWIDGSKSAGAAMKEALHGFAKQLAGEAALQALRHGAYAIGSLALGDGAAAAKHGIAALKWTGVAVAASVIGKATNSAGASNANAAAGIGGGRGSSGGDRGQTSLTVVMGDQFAGDSPRYVARKVRRNINNARMYADYEGQS